LQVAHKNKALMDYKETEDQEEMDSDEEFDMKDVVVPDLGLDKHAISEDYRDEVS
jgi:hypothetical protein